MNVSHQISSVQLWSVLVASWLKGSTLQMLLNTVTSHKTTVYCNIIAIELNIHLLLNIHTLPLNIHTTLEYTHTTPEYTHTTPAWIYTHYP